MNERNGILDFWKYIAAIGVILVHIPFPGFWGLSCSAIGLSGVCLFFLISGYACYGDSKVMTGKILKRFKRNGVITLITVTVYFISAFFAYQRENALIRFEQMLINPMTYIRMLLLGDFEFIFGYQLWFMMALLICYLIFLFIVRINMRKIVLIALVPLLLLRITVSIWEGLSDGSWFWSSNAIVGALPMMLLGYTIAIYKDKLKKITDFSLIVILLVSAVLMLFTSNYLIAGICFSQPFIMLTATALFVYAINHSSDHVFKPIEKLGREDSLYIYLSHYLFIVIFSDLAIMNHFSDMQMDWLVPATVIIASLVFARILSVFSKLISVRITNKRLSDS